MNEGKPFGDWYVVVKNGKIIGFTQNPSEGVENFLNASADGMYKVATFDEIRKLLHPNSAEYVEDIDAMVNRAWSYFIDGAEKLAKKVREVEIPTDAWKTAAEEVVDKVKRTGSEALSELKRLFEKAREQYEKGEK